MSSDTQRHDFSQASAPSWADFCEQIGAVWPEVKPDPKDTEWVNLYMVYEIGYDACLRHMKQLLEQGGQ